MMHHTPSACRATIAGAIAALCVTSAAHATVTISSAATANMTCAGGVCTPTVAKAVLNVGDLETLLASGTVEISTTGPDVQANDIEIRGAVSWSSSYTLTLDAYRSITVNKPVTAAGPGGLTVVTRDGPNSGTFSFGPKGHVSFANVSSPLTIDGTRYRLEGGLPQLIDDIIARPNKAFALVTDYDAAGDGLYRSSPVPIPFSGRFNGLGHVISNLEIGDESGANVALFAVLDKRATVGSVDLRKAVIAGTTTVGSIAGSSAGTISNSYAIATRVSGVIAGGLVGENAGTISRCRADTVVIGYSPGGQVWAGGLVGQNGYGGLIEESFATGLITGLGQASSIGGVAGLNSGDDSQTGTIMNSYATGDVYGRKQTSVGGLVGYNPGSSIINATYSTGAVRGKEVGYVGGFAGNNQPPVVNSYWDTTTSGTMVGVGTGNDTGITGLTTQQLQAALPTGFDPTIWAESPSMNNGLPYLINNPPQ
jgi:hypothetical protein